MSWIDELLGGHELATVPRSYVTELEEIAIAYQSLVWAGVEDWEGYERAKARLIELTRRAEADPTISQEDIMPLLERGAE